MKTLHNIIDQMQEVHRDCVPLLAKAEIFLAYKDPKVRAIGYEILVAVSKIMAEQKEMLKEINSISGAMAE